MWKWLKHCHGWIRHNVLWPLEGAGEPRARAIDFGYEKAGLVVRQEPIPWNAETLLIEAVIEGSPEANWSKSDFHVRMPGDVPCMAVAFDPLPEEGTFRVVFRLPCAGKTTPVRLYWRACRLGQVIVPYVGREEFLRRLKLESATLFARLGQQHVACRAVVRDQCCSLTAGGLLTSPTSLVPLLDLDLALEITDHETGLTQKLPVRLSPAQLLGRNALVSVLPPWRPWDVGAWSVHWTVEGRPLARHDFRVISQQVFQQSLYLADGRFFHDEGHTPTTWPAVSLHDLMNQARPCFLVASREPGVAGLCSLEVGVQFKDGARLPGLEEREVIVTDMPSAFVPAPIEVGDGERVHAFELFSDNRLLGTVCSYPTPVATFTGEGGFVAPPDCSWTAVAEAELEEHLNRLMGTQVPSV